MQLTGMLPTYVDALLTGDRIRSREAIRKAIATGVKAEAIYTDVLIPAMVQIREMHRNDQISTLVEHLATRVNRFITDQVQAQLAPTERNGKAAIVLCAATEGEELGAQMCADMLEASGWQAYFLGSGVPEDELIQLIGSQQPHLLVVYGSTPSDVPQLRDTIERIRDIGACPFMNVMATGGIFDRVEGLWEEIQADSYAPDPVSVPHIAGQTPQRVHLPRDPLAPKRRRRLAGGPISVN